jgi:hypothetical protein
MIISLKTKSKIAEAAPNETRKFTGDLPEIEEKMKIKAMKYTPIDAT